MRRERGVRVGGGQRNEGERVWVRREKVAMERGQREENSVGRVCRGEKEQGNRENGGSIQLFWKGANK